MNGLSAALVLLSIMFAHHGVLAGDADSAAVRVNANQVDKLEAGQVDTAQATVADTLAQGVVMERGIMARLILPALVTAAVGGLLILLFTQRG